MTNDTRHTIFLPMKWYALSFAYILGLLAHYYFAQALVCMCILVFITTHKRIFLIFFACISFSLGFANGIQKEIPPPPDYFIDNEEAFYTAQIENIDGLQDRRLRLHVSHIQKDGEEEYFSGDGVLYMYYTGSEAFNTPIAGEEIRFEGRLRNISFSNNEGISSAQDYWHNQGIYYSAYLYMNSADVEWSAKPNYLAQVRDTLYNNFVDICLRNDNTVSQTEALAIALVFGNRFYLDTQTVGLFTNASLVHSIALSGMHLGFALLCAAFIAKIIVSLFPSILFKMPFKIFLGFVSIPFALLYFWIGNAPVSLLRAGTMLFLFWLSFVLYRRMNLMDCLVLAATLILLFMPSALTDIGFQFSVLSIAAIALTTPYFGRLRQFIINHSQEKALSLGMKLFLYAASTFWISFAIQVLLFPIQANVFGLISPYFILNIVWIPLVQFLVLPFAFFSFFTMLLPQVSAFFLALSTFVSGAFIDFLLAFERNFSLQMFQTYRFDMWQGMGYFLLILTAIYSKHLKIKKNFSYILCVLLLCTYPLYSMYENYISAQEETITITLLDVGQGQSILLEWAGNRALIDAGGSSSQRFDTGRDIVAKVLTYQHFPTLDYAIVTHFDTDHAKGLVHIINHFSVDNFVYSVLDKEEEIRTQLLEDVREHNINEIQVQTHDSIVLAGSPFVLEVLSPPAEGNYSSNNASLVLRLMHNEKGLAIFFGDIEESGINRLLEENLDIQAELLVLPHHGSKHSYSEELYARVNPTHVWVSASKYNLFGHPDPSIIDYFARRNIPVRNTADGEIIRMEF